MQQMVSGLVNGNSKDSMFNSNPYGWLEIKVVLDFPLETSLEEAFYKAACDKISFMQIAQVKDVKLEDNLNIEHRKDKSYTIDDFD